MRRAVVLTLALLLAAGAGILGGRAEDFPSRPIRLIVGFPPGSAADITARVVGDAMTRTLGQQVVVETRPGAGSSIAADFVAHAPADGYTLFIGTSSSVTDAVTNHNLRFDFVKDFAPIAPLTGLPLILAVPPGLGVSSFAGLIALARSKPGELTYASVGVGTVPQLACELIAVRTKTRLVHVPYPGSPQAVTDLMAGRVSMMLGVASTIMPQVNAGKLVGLASASAQRPRIAPDLPTIAEAGLPGFEASVWFGLMAPAGTPRPVIDRLAAAANAALKSDEAAARLRASGFEPLGGEPDTFANFIAGEMVKWREAAEAAGVKN